MSGVALRPIGVFIAALTLLVAHNARAECGCSCPAEDAPFFRGSATRSPETIARNARIFARLSRFDPGSVRIEAEGGAIVEHALEPAGDAAGVAYWIVPTLPLSPGSYTISATQTGGRFVHREAFVVLDEDDVAPPTVTGLHIETSVLPDLCSDLIGSAFVAWDRDPRGSAETLVVEVELLRDGTSLGRVFPSYSGPPGTRGLGTAAEPACFGEAHLDGLVAGEALTARVRMLDLAGNATTPADFDFVALESHAAPQSECGRWCSAGVGAATSRSLPMCLLAALLALLARRRRGRGAD